MSNLSTDNYKKHTAQNPLQRKLIDNFYSVFLEEAKNLKPDSVLDVGCGEGFTLEKFKNRGIGKKLVGIDFLDTAIKIGKKERPYLDLRIGNIYDIPFEDKSFDLVVCSEVLEHVDDPQKALSELERVTKKYVLLSVPNEPFFILANFLRGKNWSRFGNDIEHINHWSMFGFEKFISSKYEVVTRKQPFPWTIIVGKKKS